MNRLLGYLNDLWRYNIASNQWTWISGNDTRGQNGIYGTQGIGSISNIPGGRSNSISWTDSSNNLWLFGGNGYDSIGSSQGFYFSYFKLLCFQMLQTVFSKLYNIALYLIIL